MPSTAIRRIFVGSCSHCQRFDGDASRRAFDQLFTDQISGCTDIPVVPAYVGYGDSNREVIFRFAEELPDDIYRVDILGRGTLALKNVAGEPFNGGVDKASSLSWIWVPRFYRSFRSLWFDWRMGPWSNVAIKFMSTSTTMI